MPPPKNRKLLINHPALHDVPSPFRPPEALGLGHPAETRAEAKVPVVLDMAHTGGRTRVVYKALKRIFKVNLGASLVVGTRLDRKFAREIDGKLLEKQVKTPPNTSLMPPLNTRKLLINHPDRKTKPSVGLGSYGKKRKNNEDKAVCFIRPLNGSLN